MLHKVIKGLRNYSYYIAALWYYIALFGKYIHARAHTHIRVRIEYTKRWKEAITSVRIRRYAPSSRFRFHRRDRNAYIPSRRKGERGRGGSSLGRVNTGNRIDSTDSHVCPRSRGRPPARARARVPMTRVCARDPLHRVRDYARSLDQGRSLFTPTGTDVIPIYRRFPRASFHPPSLPLGICTLPVLSLAWQLRDASHPLRVRSLTFLREFLSFSLSHGVDGRFHFAHRGRNVCSKSGESTGPIEFHSGFGFRRCTPGCYL